MSKKDLIYASGIDPKKIIYKQIAVYNEPDRSFEQYGHLLYPTLVPKAGILDKGGYREWEQNGDFMDFLNPNEPFYPHEEVYQQLNTAFENNLKGTGMHIRHTYTSHKGRSSYWECLSDRFDTKIKDSYELDDTVQVGMVVRNGIGTNVALGIDFFTYRLTCKNGAISSGQAAGNIKVIHAGSYSRMRDRFLEAIPIAIERAKDLIDYYQRSVYVRTNQRIAEDFYKRLRNNITVKYFPANFNIDKDQIKKDPESISKIVNFTPKGEEKLWETFNNFTEKIWKSDRLEFTGIRNGETAVHKALIANIPR